MGGGILTRILDILRAAQGPIEIRDLARQLDIEPAALEGMLATLRQMGHLAEVSCGSQHCDTCRARAGCVGSSAPTGLAVSCGKQVGP